MDGLLSKCTILGSQPPTTFVQWGILQEVQVAPWPLAQLFKDLEAELA